MTAARFRSIALSLPETEERAHMNHPDFRVGGKIFATLGYPSAGWAMVKLTPTQQQLYTIAHRDAFLPITGAWGRRGATNVRLRDVGARIARQALTDAWRNTVGGRAGTQEGRKAEIQGRKAGKRK
jgi:hypothetical protein